MSTNPNTVKSQDDTTEDELGRTMTLLRAIEQLEKTECELERVEKQLDIAVKCLKQYADRYNWYNTYKSNSLDECPIAYKERWKKEYGYKQAEKTLKRIEELNK